jgi:hypothetical protein
MLRRRHVLTGLAASAAPFGVQAQAPEVDLLLVLFNDGSGSIDADEYRLQREGTAAALEHPQVLAAIGRMRHRAIAVAYGEWGSPGAPAWILDWTRIGGEEDASRFADRLLAAPREFQSYNAIGDALDLGTARIRTAPFRSARATIDLAGDGPDMRSLVPAPVARDRAIAMGITINALAIQGEGAFSRVGPLREHYEANVIGGPNAFATAARDRIDFAHAIFNKLIREIS